MSGIAGIFYLDGRPVVEESLKRMTSVVAYRGPDGIGQWVQGSIGLGHLQLCTTPESLQERQPLVSNDGNLAIVWDGRVDNREELVRDLSPHAPVNVATTDAELILCCYRTWGEECARRIIGDFAFAIWDGIRQQLFCARDPIGMRLFHYYFNGRVFIFATEIKQIFQHMEVPCQLNEAKLGLYLCGSPGDADSTFYQHILRLPGGECLRVSRDGVAKAAFWDPDPYDEIRYKDPRDYSERFRELIFEAVRCRMRSSTGVEILLSGGLDSGAIASVAGTLVREGSIRNVDLSAQTAVYRNAPLDEAPYVRLVAEQYGIPVNWLPVDDCWAMKPTEMGAGLDEPLKLHLEAMHGAALQSTKERGIRVVLTGEGGDETSMMGTDLVHVQEWLHRFQWWRLGREVLHGTPYYRHRAMRVVGRSMVPRWARRLAERDNLRIPPWITQDFARRCQLAQRLRSLETHSRREGLYLQQRGRGTLFLRGEIRHAPFFMEWRHPFYDSRIVEFLARIPPEIRFRGGRNRILLREAMSGVLAEPIRLRGPHGAFQGLLDRGLKEMESNRLLDLLQDSVLVRMGVIDSTVVQETFQSYLDGKEASAAGTIMTFLTEEWLRQHERWAHQVVAA